MNYCQETRIEKIHVPIFKTEKKLLLRIMPILLNNEFLLTAYI